MIRIITLLLEIILELVGVAEEDDAIQEEALMKAQEKIKAELDRRKFGKP